tara:strand:+ start:2106 stop:3533 length:1428 start_codon:yes stop_codon:yes gene_type:complete
MELKNLSFQDTIKSLPDCWPIDLISLIRDEIALSDKKIFIMDDDPTGSQTVKDVAMLSDWSVDSLEKEFHCEELATFIQINTRACNHSEVERIVREVTSNILEAKSRVSKDVEVIFRSDSTLRGHFPLEMDVFSETLKNIDGQDYDALIFIPFFIQGQRYTFNDIQYTLEGDKLIPVGDTPFADDPAFPYESSNLKEWMEEKYKGQIQSENVISISIEDIRLGGPDKVQEILKSLNNHSICIVNAMDMKDLYVFTLGLLRAEKEGSNFLYRTAASFVKARIGQSEYPFLTREEIINKDSGGALIIVGSHVPGSTQQLNKLIEFSDINPIELNVQKILDNNKSQEEFITHEIDRLLNDSQDVVLYTSRNVVVGHSSEEYLQIGTKITNTIVNIVKNISVKPSYILSKGGMTSASVTRKGLNIQRAIIPGQILSGVLVMEMGCESKYPGSKLILFPGNVGDPDAILNVFTKLNTKSY